MKNMPLVPDVVEHCYLPMRVTRARRICDTCHVNSENLSVPLDRKLLVRNWPRCHQEYKSLVWNLECQQCGHTIEQRFEKGRAPLWFLPGTYDTRVFIGGNYDHMKDLRDIKDAVFELNADLVPILPYDDFQILRGQIHDWDLRLLHNCKNAIFDVTEPAGELMEIERCAEYKTITLLVYDSRGLADAPPRVRTMLLESGQHEHRAYGDINELKAIVQEFLLEKDPRAFRRAKETFGYHFAGHTVKHKINMDGTAEHEYRYLGLKVDVHDFSLTQVPHGFGITSGEYVEFDLEANARVSWKEDPDRSHNRARLGLAVFDPPLVASDKSVDYNFRVRTKGIYVLRRGDLVRVPEEAKKNALLAAGREFSSREIPYPIEKFNLSIEYPEGYNVRPESVAYQGLEQRADGIRIPPDKFSFENAVAKLEVSKPRVSYRYCIVWEIPE